MSEVEIIKGDCLKVLVKLAEEGVKFDAVVTDPPYHIGFMGKKWDGGDIAKRPEVWKLCLDLLKPGGHLVSFGGSRTHHRVWCAIEDAGFELRDTIMWLYGSGFPKSLNVSDAMQGWGTALKPAHEPIMLARKPLIGTVRKNIREHGTGAINVDGCRPAGRWPANVCHDGSEEVIDAFGRFGKRSGGHHADKASGFGSRAYNGPGKRTIPGTADRFFYCAKASKKERDGSKHPTIKPIKLMRWLVRMITPVGGKVLDPFAGSGTTGAACDAEGLQSVLIERDDEYFANLQRRFGVGSPAWRRAKFQQTINQP